MNRGWKWCLLYLKVLVKTLHLTCIMSWVDFDIDDNVLPEPTWVPLLCIRFFIIMYFLSIYTHTLQFSLCVIFHPQTLNINGQWVPVLFCWLNWLGWWRRICYCLWYEWFYSSYSLFFSESFYVSCVVLWGDSNVSAAFSLVSESSYVKL